jgi:hypothetical protein
MFDRRFAAKVLRFEHLANLDLLSAVERSAASATRSRLPSTSPPKPEAGNQLVGPRKRPLNDGSLFAYELDPHAFRTRVQSIGSQHYARFHELFVELPHLGEQLAAGKNARFGFLARFHYDHHPHRRFSLSDSREVSLMLIAQH